MKVSEQIPITAYKTESGFIADYQKLIRETVIPYQYEILNDNIEGAEKSHVIKNFINAGKVLRGEKVDESFYGMVFQDSDLAKWLEAAAYSLACCPDKELEEKCDSLIEIIAQAQDEDGYLDTAFTIEHKERRYKNLLEGHELYCAGHMAEAAAAYFETTGKDKLLNVMLKNAESIYKHFVTEKNEGYPGHPEIELALMKLYRASGNKHCLELAEHFIDVRGADNGFYKKEREKRDWTVWGNNAEDGAYQQSGQPVREQADATGHSVRAVYLYTGMADSASERNDDKLKKACRALWQSITQKRMYVTGGIGSTVNGEAFTVDYDLHNDSAYCETCASVGLMFFASRMLETEIKSEYADIMEKSFYNTVLSGMALDGKSFFYVNPLETVPQISGVSANMRHDLPQRPSWYACACCPPNVARLIASFGKYAYGENETTAFCHLYAQGEVEFKNGLKLRCTTQYPYGFTVNYKIISGGKLAVRIPCWSEKFSIKINNSDCAYELIDGYAYTDVNDGDLLSFDFDDSVKRVYASPKISADTGCVAVQRGPIVYCAEGVDNGGNAISLSLPRSSEIKVDGYDEKIGAITLSADGINTLPQKALYSFEKPLTEKVRIKLIPYYCRANRGLSELRVWLNEN